MEKRSEDLGTPTEKIRKQIVETGPTLISVGVEETWGELLGNLGPMVAVLAVMVVVI